MVLGIGTDIVRNDRFASWLGRPALMGRYFSLEEIAFCMEQGTNASASLAARFAAKEAFGKALGCGLSGLVLRDITVVRSESGRPVLTWGRSVAEAIDRNFKDAGPCIRVHLSLSHEREYSVAMVVVEIEPSVAGDKTAPEGGVTDGL